MSAHHKECAECAFRDSAAPGGLIISQLRHTRLCAPHTSSFIAEQERAHPLRLENVDKYKYWHLLHTVFGGACSFHTIVKQKALSVLYARRKKNNGVLRLHLPYDCIYIIRRIRHIIVEFVCIGYYSEKTKTQRILLHNASHTKSSKRNQHGNQDPHRCDDSENAITFDAEPRRNTRMALGAPYLLGLVDEHRLEYSSGVVQVFLQRFGRDFAALQLT